MPEQSSGSRVLKIYEFSCVVDCMAIPTPHFLLCMTLFMRKFASRVLLVDQPGSRLRHTTDVNNPSSPQTVAQGCGRHAHWSHDTNVRNGGLGR
ncbi:hypothetical protein BKA66DRAFT_244717 [Pyrenochaeta sp. MPI-SDFR-AT-0127]|nr:hypothetical protein BKA66DRAFT_244717 [Pyrenochaeta sp. MPI-SDFR-AT-0127]